MLDCVFEWDPGGFLLDLSPVAPILASYPAGLEADALSAIVAMCARTIEQFEHMHPDTAWLSASREAQFLITSLRLIDRLIILNIQIDWLGTFREASAFGIFLDGNLVLRKEQGPGVDPRPGPNAYLPSTLHALGVRADLRDRPDSDYRPLAARNACSHKFALHLAKAFASRRSDTRGDISISVEQAFAAELSQGRIDAGLEIEHLGAFGGHVDPAWGADADIFPALVHALWCTGAVGGPARALSAASTPGVLANLSRAAAIARRLGMPDWQGLR